MISLKELVEWHAELALPISFGWSHGPRKPEYGQGDNVGVITPTTGPGEDLEGVGDWAGFQVVLIGQEYQYDQLQQSAMEVDRQLRFGNYPANLWGTRVRTVTRSGGPPDMLQEDQNDRISFVCTYLVHELIVI